MPFKNRVRLPFKITRPQFPTEREVFRLADGSSRTIKAIVRKTYQGETDYLPESYHQRLVIALNHDDVVIEGDKYLGGVALDGDYQIEWPDFLDYPIGKAAFTVQTTPFDATNANCQSCEEANQLDLANDTIPGELEEDTEYTHNIAANDNICCYPAVFSLITYDTTYIASATIDETGLLTITTQASFPLSSVREFLTYRVTCPNGAYDEAIVSAAFDGSEPAVCGEISDLVVTVDGLTADVAFDEPTPQAESYYWELFLSTDLITPIDTGTVANSPISLTGLNESTEYRITLVSVCYGGATSEPVFENFASGSDEGETCGRYSVQYLSPGGQPSDFTIFNYTNCAGNSQNDIIFHGQTKTICALQTTPGNIVQLTGVTSYSYVELC